MNKIITVIGLGNVGQTIVQNLLMLNSSSFIINVMDPADVSGSILDLQHAAAVEKKHQLYYNNKQLFEQSDYIFHTAGPYFELGTSRLSVTDKSIEMTHQIFDAVEFQSEPFIIVISNPVDIISYHVWKATALSQQKVFGVGTYLDTVRFQQYLAEEFEVSTNDVEAIVLGEHGDSQVPISSQLKINNVDTKTVEALAKINKAILKTPKAAHQIRLTQGATKFGVSTCAIKMFLAILENKPFYTQASVLLNEENRTELNCPELYISVPVLIDKDGVKQFSIVHLTNKEKNKLAKSAEILSEHLQAQKGMLIKK